ncbi:MAG: YHYH protein [Rhodobacterales bacterium]|nr:YHYH protein [Rhodobacterales bacterium]
MRLIPVLALFLMACGASESNVDDSDVTVPTTEPDCAAASQLPALSAHAANSAYDAPDVVVSCSDDALIVTSNGIPDFEFVALTPNGLASQDYEWTVPLNPIVAAAPTDIPLLGVAAFSVSGLPMYGPNEAEFPDPYGDPIYNGIVDRCMGHTGGQADYHFHALLTDCVRQGFVRGNDEASPLIGYALDGFGIYGRWGCADDACSSLIEFQSSWQQTGDPTTYAWDNHEYVAQNGDEYLDECNGHTSTSGEYHYHATEGFPYIIGCYTGTANEDTGAGGGPGAGNGGPPTCDEVEVGMPCCGDDICDGPETADNCAADCG